MTAVLVSGAAGHVAEVAEALRGLGAQVTEVADLEDVPEVVGSAEAFDCYVQLGATFTVRGDTAVRRVHHFFADGVLARFTALDTVLAAKTPPQRVVFVMGVLPREVSGPADRDARRALTQVLAQAARADVAPAFLDVAILEASARPDEIANAALGTAALPPGDPATMDDALYQDWRVEFLGLAQLET